MVANLFPAPLNTGTALHPDVSIAQGVIVEMLLTSLVVFTILMLAAEQHEATFLAPVGIGLAVFLVHMVGEFPDLLQFTLEGFPTDYEQVCFGLEHH